jgi:hypothetical protein
VTLSVATLGEATVRRTYHFYCGPDTGILQPHVVSRACGRLTSSDRAHYFGVPSGPKSAGPLQGAVTIRGLAGGVRVARSYYLGSRQYRDWMQILGRDPSGIGVQR